ncbi:MAG: DinB family protein [Bryobacteraceae bacterium]
MINTLKLTTLASVLCLLALSLAPAIAQTPANPISAGQKGLYAMVKNNLIRGAEKMPEENYSFKPTPEVRSFGQLIGHVADAQYMFCSTVLGEKNPAPGIEKNKTSKADLVQALKDAAAYCDKAYDGLTDAQAVQMVKFFGQDRAQATVLAWNTVHSMEHYGNMVTYLRLKGIVPPSSEGRR